MKAILWDGNKKINGELFLKKKRIEFRLVDFAETDLDFDLPYVEIDQVTYYHLYQNHTAAIKITSNQNSNNIFIIEDPIKVKADIEARCNYLKKMNSP